MGGLGRTGSDERKKGKKVSKSWPIQGQERAVGEKNFSAFSAFGRTRNLNLKSGDSNWQELQKRLAHFRLAIIIRGQQSTIMPCCSFFFFLHESKDQNTLFCWRQQKSYQINSPSI